MIERSLSMQAFNRTIFVNIFVFLPIWVRLHPDFNTHAFGHWVIFSGKKVTAPPPPPPCRQSEGARTPMIIPCLRFTGISRISSVKVHFFITPVTRFLKYFRAECREILKSGSREIGVIPRKLFRSQSQLLTYYACAALNWVLSVTKVNLRIVGFFALLPFLTYLSNKRLKPSIHCVQS